VVACLDGFEELKLNLKSFFIIFPAHDQEWEQVVVDSYFKPAVLCDQFDTQQNTMYEAFLLDLPPSERETNIGWMCEACERSNDHCKQCFRACLLAIGGNYMKQGSKTLWVNIQAARMPVFATV